MNTDDPSRPNPPPQTSEWIAKKRVSDALRQFIEITLTSSPPVDELNEIADLIEQASNRFAVHRRVYGRFDWLATGEFKTFGHVFKEMNLFTGGINPFGPSVETWKKGDRYYGKVNVGWIYEGPPQCVHGGILAALFDHFLGEAQIPLANQLGMTRYLNVSYMHPTPLNTDLTLIGWLVQKEGRKAFINGEIYDGETLTASCEALFIQPRGFVPDVEQKK